MSVVVNSVEPGPVHVKVWGDSVSYFGCFLSALSLWRYVKDYEPGISLPSGENPVLN